jgi:ABC-type transporter Mla subunit MlaD
MDPELLEQMAQGADALDSLNAAVKGLIPVLAAFSEAIKPTVSLFAALQEAIKPNLSLLAAQQESIKAAISPLTALAVAAKPAAALLEELTGAFKSAVQQAAGGEGLLPRSGQRQEEVFAERAKPVGADEAKRQGSGLGGAFAELAHAMKGTIASLANMAVGLRAANSALRTMAEGVHRAHLLVLGKLESLAGVIAPFVQALNPSMTFGLNYAMQSLKATIGTALVPVAQVLTSAFREFAGVLLPAMQKLAAPLGSVARAFVNVLRPTIHLIADSIGALKPVLDALGEASHTIVAAFAAVRATLVTVGQALASWIKSFFGAGEFKDLVKSFQDAIRRMTEMMLQAVAKLAHFFGAVGFAHKLAENLRKIAGAPEADRGKTGAPPAPTDVGYRSFEDIGKTLAAAAFAAQGTSGAGGAAAEKSEKEWLQKMAETLDAMKDEGPTLANAIQGLEQKLDKAVQEMVDGIVRGAKERGEELWEKAKLYFRTEAALLEGKVIGAISDAVDRLPGASLWGSRGH